MKNIEITKIKEKIKQLIVKASFNLPEDIREALEEAYNTEPNTTARKILYYILENEKISRKESLPLCQDCGSVYINILVGKNICIQGDNLNRMANEAIAEVYSEYYLRKSIVDDPLYLRENTGNNNPAILDIGYFDGDGIDIEVCLKGGGSENCSYLFMLNPSTTEAEIVEVICRMVKENVSKCCPPVIMGIGLGSTASGVVKLARKASFRNVRERNKNRDYKKLEKKILDRVNQLDIGPQGLGGKTTALACNIEYAPCHMATLPMALFLGCHSLRRACSKISPP
ncbi:MAG: fumarate hydratase [Candidatus Humimicrobiaceae bacterium]